MSSGSSSRRERDDIVHAALLVWQFPVPGEYFAFGTGECFGFAERKRRKVALRNVQ